MPKMSPSPAERRFFAFALSFGLLFSLVGLLSLGYGVYLTLLAGDPWGSFFETLYLFAHLIWALFASYLLFRAHAEGSYVLRTLCFDEHGNRKKSVFWIALLLGLPSLGGGIYFALASFFDALPPTFFPWMLRLCLGNALLFLFFLCLLFFLYPLRFSFASGRRTFG